MSCLYEPLIVALERDVSTRGFEVTVCCGSALFGLAQDVGFKLLREQIRLSTRRFSLQFSKIKCHPKSLVGNTKTVKLI